MFLDFLIEIQESCHSIDDVFGSGRGGEDGPSAREPLLGEARLDEESGPLGDEELLRRLVVSRAMFDKPVVHGLAVAGGAPSGHARQVTDAASQRRLLLPLDVADDEGGDDAVDEGISLEVFVVEVVEEFDLGHAVHIIPEASASELEVKAKLNLWYWIREGHSAYLAGGSAELDDPVRDRELVSRVEVLERIEELDGVAWHAKLITQLLRFD